ncbi:MAG: hypothetical protein ACOYMF_01850 [Bacteroidales bacterium]
MAARKKKFKVTYSKVELKIPTVQKRRLKAFCKASDTTINKVYRKAIREFIERHAHPIGHTQMISENQMTIFDLCEDPAQDYQGKDPVE